MTTLISLAARDFIVVGCDSLATASADLVFPGQLAMDYFDASGALKLDLDGKPLLKMSYQLWEKAESIPVDNLPSVTKLFSLEPYRAALLFSGTSRIGETTIRNLVETFHAQLPSLDAKKKKGGAARQPYTMQGVAENLRDFIVNIYRTEIPDEAMRPSMDIILSGYSEQFREPELWRIQFAYNRTQMQFTANVSNAVERKKYNVIFGGQYDVVQRIVNGIDNAGTWAIRESSVAKLEECFAELQSQVDAAGVALTLTKPDFWDNRYNVFGVNRGGVKGIFADVGNLSEQAGIDLVYFLVSVMIQAQTFATSIPTVGGKIHIALFSKDSPFRWISEEAYTFEGKPIPKFHPNARN